VAVLAEAVYNGEDDRLAIHAWQGLNEVHPNVCPHGHRHG
jgi:hypothetical protein